jgi:glycosyltransferase involved in cell wall biosynthesis
VAPLVSVAICVRNEERHIKGCVDSLLRQTFRDFELILVDDGSSDRTLEIINAFKDNRIKCFKNKECLGIAKSRNIAIKHSTGKYIFCTDADCTVNETWIEEGLRCFETGCLGIEGKLVYVSPNYEPTFSTQFMDNKSGGHFMTASVAYRKDIIEAVGGFNEKINHFADRDLGLKVTKLGKVCFNENMIAVHPLVFQTPKGLIKSASRIEGRVYLFKRFGERVSIEWRLVDPFNLAKIFFPELILVSLVFNKFKQKEDFRLLPFTYLYAVLERLHIWKACVKYRVFLI